MEKQELLNELSIQVAQGIISREEVTLLLGINAQPIPTAPAPQVLEETKEEKAASRRLKLSEALYYIGGGIVFIGIATMIEQNWSSLNDFLRIFVTLGFGCVFYIIAVLLERYLLQSRLSQAFFLLSGLVIPLGLAVTFYVMGQDVSTLAMQTVISGIMVAIFGLTFWLFRTDAVQVLLVVFATWFYFALTGLLTEGNDYFGIDFLYYRTLILAASYISIAYYYFVREVVSIRATLFAVGTILILGATFGLIHWEDPVNVIYLLLYPFVIAAGIYFSIFLKNKVMLVISAISIVVFIMALTGKYFAESLGWPIVLMFSGLIIVGVGYFVFYLNNNYFEKKNSLPPATPVQ